MTEPTTTVIDTTTTGQFAINTEASVIEWAGSKATGSGHGGTIKLQSGELSVFKGNINGGKMVLDMNSITVTDLEGQDKADLEGHLKDSDFFEVGKFPIGGFEFGSTMPLEGDASGAKHVAAGSLLLKGIAKPIRIPFNMRIADGKVTVETPEFSIIRTEWGLQYKSGVIGTVKDELISDQIKLKIKLETTVTGQ